MAQVEIKWKIMVYLLLLPLISFWISAKHLWRGRQVFKKKYDDKIQKGFFLKCRKSIFIDFEIMIITFYDIGCIRWWVSCIGNQCGYTYPKNILFLENPDEVKPLTILLVCILWTDLTDNFYIPTFYKVAYSPETVFRQTWHLRWKQEV